MLGPGVGARAALVGWFVIHLGRAPPRRCPPLGPAQLCGRSTEPHPSRAQVPVPGIPPGSTSASLCDTRAGLRPLGPPSANPRRMSCTAPRTPQKRLRPRSRRGTKNEPARAVKNLGGRGLRGGWGGSLTSRNREGSRTSQTPDVSWAGHGPPSNLGQWREPITGQSVPLLQWSACC